VWCRVLRLRQQCNRRYTRELSHHRRHTTRVLRSVPRNRNQNEVRFLFPKIRENFIKRFSVERIAQVLRCGINMRSLQRRENSRYWSTNGITLGVGRHLNLTVRVAVATLTESATYTGTSDARHAFRTRRPSDPRASSFLLYFDEANGRTIADSIAMILIRGKSGLQWTGCQVTPGHRWRESPVTDSATENRPPSFGTARVKRWSKSPPRSW